MPLNTTTIKHLEGVKLFFDTRWGREITRSEGTRASLEGLTMVSTFL